MLKYIHLNRISKDEMKQKHLECFMKWYTLWQTMIQTVFALLAKFPDLLLQTCHMTDHMMTLSETGSRRKQIPMSICFLSFLHVHVIGRNYLNSLLLVYFYFLSRQRSSSQFYHVAKRLFSWYSSYNITKVVQLVGL